MVTKPKLPQSPRWWSQTRQEALVPCCSPLLRPTEQGRHQSASLYRRLGTRTQPDLFSVLFLTFQTQRQGNVFLYSRSPSKWLRKQIKHEIHLPFQNTSTFFFFGLIHLTNSNSLTTYQWNTANICLLWDREDFACLALLFTVPWLDTVFLLICQMRKLWQKEGGLFTQDTQLLGGQSLEPRQSVFKAPT